MAEPTEPRAAYHHGDARNALLRAASGLLEQAGAATLSLRQVAAQAGLSRQAPYHHFPDKETLLAELVRDAFERLGQDVTAIDHPSLAPVVRLEHAASAYIAFAQGAPALFRLMFSRELVDLDRHPAARHAAEASLATLTRIVAALAPPDRVADFTLLAWSAVHGYATLTNELTIEPAAQSRARAADFARALAAAATQAHEVARPRRNRTSS